MRYAIPILLGNYDHLDAPLSLLYKKTTAAGLNINLFQNDKKLTVDQLSERIKKALNIDQETLIKNFHHFFEAFLSSPDAVRIESIPGLDKIIIDNFNVRGMELNLERFSDDFIRKILKQIYSAAENKIIHGATFFGKQNPRLMSLTLESANPETLLQIKELMKSNMVNPNVKLFWSRPELAYLKQALDIKDPQARTLFLQKHSMKYIPTSIKLKPWAIEIDRSNCPNLLKTIFKSFRPAL
jgi:hypothetical protein